MCALCHRGQTYDFDKTQTAESDWRITNNPLAWGGSEPEVIVLGFSKGPTQAGALNAQRHNDIAFRGGRSALAKILHHIGLIAEPSSRVIDDLVSDPNGRFHFGSLIRCTVERFDASKRQWMGTGGGMLDRFVGTEFGRGVLHTCMRSHLSGLPAKTRLVVMLGLGTKGAYVSECRKAFEATTGEAWHAINEVAYSNGSLTVVHTEHFKAQGALLPNWLSNTQHPRGRLGLLARAAVQSAGFKVE